VLWLLIGWQFALAEFVGGAIMITLFVLIAPHVFPAAELESARHRLEAAAAAQGRPGGSDQAEREEAWAWPPGCGPRRGGRARPATPSQTSPCCAGSS